CMLPTILFAEPVYSRHVIASCLDDRRAIPSSTSWLRNEPRQNAYPRRVACTLRSSSYKNRSWQSLAVDLALEDPRTFDLVPMSITVPDSCRIDMGRKTQYRKCDIDITAITGQSSAAIGCPSR